MKNKILILYNQPHKAQMVKLRDWLQRNLPQYHYELCKQLKFLWKMKTGSSAIHAILTYNKSLYWKSVVKQIIKYCEKGGKVIALHHNISSMMLKRPEWLEFAKIQITKGKNVRYPWAATEGGTLHIYNLSDTHPITSDNLEYNEKGPAVNFNPTNEDLIFTRNLSEEKVIKYQEGKGEKQAVFTIEHGEYFINHVVLPDPNRKILLGQYYVNEEGSKHYYSANAGWITKRGKGTLMYFMPGHAVSSYTDNYCNILKNSIEY